MLSDNYSSLTDMILQSDGIRPCKGLEQIFAIQRQRAYIDSLVNYSPAMDMAGRYAIFIIGNIWQEVYLTAVGNYEMVISLRGMIRIYPYQGCATCGRRYKLCGSRTSVNFE